ncbi:MAG TPA: response regulator transcription factor [Bacteroidia bacterium]|nr:response regulator transcription factor [Bacteroidia bacterium]
MIKIAIADDHQMFIDGLQSLLKGNKNMSVSCVANNGEALLQALEKSSVDVILMDVNMPVMDGIEATKQVKQKHPDTRVIMLTMFSSKDYIEKLLRAGANGYILKNTGKEELTTAIERVMQGESYFSKEVTERIMEGLQGKKAENNPHMVELTEREKDVLRLIAQELTSHEIADKLFISFHTVETHRKNLISKLQVKNIAGLVKYAVQNGLAGD